jgi:hypothetical protein
MESCASARGDRHLAGGRSESGGGAQGECLSEICWRGGERGNRNSEGTRACTIDIARPSKRRRERVMAYAERRQ